MRLSKPIALAALLCGLTLSPLPAQVQDFPLQLAQAPDSLSLDIVPLAPHQQGAEPLSAQETHPNAKRLASEIALAITTYGVGEGPEAIAARLPPEALGIAETSYQPGTW